MGVVLPAYGASIDGVSGSIIGDQAANLAQATAFNRPEDMEIGLLDNGHEFLLFTATGSHQIFGLNIDTNTLSVFADRNTINLATGLAVGNALTAPDNLAIDADGNFYIVEDQAIPNADIWRAVDLNNDGDLLDPGEGLSRWAALRTVGAEPSGLFFSLADPNVAYVNVQHPRSGNDALVELRAVPVPVSGAAWLMGGALFGILGLARRKKRS